MKNEYPVRAHRTETKYDTKDQLMTLLDLQVPSDALEFLREAHVAQESKYVTFRLCVRAQRDGDWRYLSFNSKGSKMKDFVPVVTLEKFASSHDDVNSLFDPSLVELVLMVEVQEPRSLFGEGDGEEGEGQDQGELDAAGAEAEADGPTVAGYTPMGVLNAPAREAHALPSTEQPDVVDADFTVHAEPPTPGEDDLPFPSA